MNNTTELLTTCSPFVRDEYVGVAILSACTGAVSALASLVVICGILVSKKCLFFIQRLILYLSVTVFLNSISVVLRLQRLAAFGGHYSDRLHPLCVFTAFLDQTTSWSTLVAISCITCYLLLNVVLLRQVEKLEKLYIALIIFLPIPFNLIPLAHNSYGEAGAWCWIRAQNENCEMLKFGTSLRFILWYIPLYIVLVGILVTYLYILYRVRRMKRHWDGRVDPSNTTIRGKMRKEFRPLIWYPLIFLILGIFPTINRVYGAFSDEPSLTLWVLHAFFSPLRGGFIALAYALDGQTIRRLFQDGCCSVTSIFWRRKTRVEEYPASRGKSDSFSVIRTESHKSTSISHHQRDLHNGDVTCNLKTEYFSMTSLEGYVFSQSVTVANDGGFCEEQPAGWGDVHQSTKL